MIFASGTKNVNRHCNVVSQESIENQDPNVGLSGMGKISSKNRHH